MEQLVNYKGFDIRVTTGQTVAGNCWGKYQITAASQGAKRVFARKPVSGFGDGQFHVTTTDQTTNLTMLNRDLVSMAMQEINMALASLGSARFLASYHRPRNRDVGRL